MLVLFVIAADVAIVATIMAITVRVVLHALLYLALSLVAVGVVFYSLGAPFVAALEVIIYAGAVIVLFIFAVMLLAPDAVEQREEGHGTGRVRTWILPAVLTAVLIGELVYLLTAAPSATVAIKEVGPHAVGRSLFGPYALVVELASMLLLVALIGARHLAGHRESDEQAESAAAPAAGEAAEGGGLGDALLPAGPAQADRPLTDGGGAMAP